MSSITPSLSLSLCVCVSLSLFLSFFFLCPCLSLSLSLSLFLAPVSLPSYHHILPVACIHCDFGCLSPLPPLRDLLYWGMRTSFERLLISSSPALFLPLLLTLSLLLPSQAITIGSVLNLFRLSSVCNVNARSCVPAVHSLDGGGNWVGEKLSDKREG